MPVVHPQKQKYHYEEAPVFEQSKAVQIHLEHEGGQQDLPSMKCNTSTIQPPTQFASPYQTGKINIVSLIIILNWMIYVSILEVLINALLNN